jgi:UDP-3-O-[3-hydroxymyristoyl] N-acetylglucosamine deacetylase
LAIVLSGRTLHADVEASVTLERIDGPLHFVQNGHAANLSDLYLGRTDQGVVLTDGGSIRVDLVEHLLSAFGGTGVRRGVRVAIDGPELPLLGGGSHEYVDALARLGLAPPGANIAAGALLEIREEATLSEGTSVYRFTPAEAVGLDVTIDFEHPAIGRQNVCWNGDVASYASRIAPARTFGLATDLERLVKASRAHGAAQRHTDVLGAILVYGHDAIVPTGRPAEADEPARHKLLDLVGDLFVHGGPPLGTLAVHCPGHAATHDVMSRALERGIVARRCNAGP